MYIYIYDIIYIYSPSSESICMHTDISLMSGGVYVSSKWLIIGTVWPQLHSPKDWWMNVNIPQKPISARNGVLNISVPKQAITSDAQSHIEWVYSRPFSLVVYIFPLMNHCFFSFMYCVHATLTSLSPFYKHGLILIPAWISNYIHCKVWD